MGRMTNRNKTKQQLIEEIEALKNEINLLRGSEDQADRLSGKELIHGSETITEMAEGMLGCVPANAALIDDSGKIIAVNNAWKRFAEENDAPAADHYLGLNYLDVCLKAQGSERAEALRAAEGIKSVLKGRAPQFSFEYPCHSECEKRWFRLLAAPFSFKGCVYAVLMHQNITGKVETEEKLTHSENRYRSVLDNAAAIINNASDAIFVTDARGRIIQANNETCRRLGYNREELNEMTIMDICPPGSAELARRHMEEILQNGSAVFETVHLRRDGTPVPSEITARLIDYYGEPAFAAIGRDITLRKQNEELLLKVNNENVIRRNALYKAIPDLILLLDSHGVFIDCHIPEGGSPEFPVTDLIGKKASSLFPGLATSEIKASFNEVLKTGKVFVAELPLAAADGQFFFELRAVKCGKEELLLLVRDITGKKKDEQEINKLSLAVEQSPVIVLITDKKGNIEYVNPRFTEITGYSFEEVIGENPRILKSEFTPGDQYKELWERLSNGEHWKGEFRNRKKNGELFWELASIFPLKNTQGEVTRFVAVKEDITEKKRAEELLRQSEESYRTLFEDISAIMLVAEHSTGTIVKASSGAARFYGYDKPSLVGMNLSNISCTPYEEMEHLSNSAKTDPDDTHHFQKHRLADGTIKEVEIHMSAIQLRGRSLLFLFIEDITKRKETEARLAEYRDHLERLVELRTESLKEVNRLLGIEIEQHKAAEEKIKNHLHFLQTLIDTIPNPIIIKDKEGRLIDCNKAHEAYFGIGLEEIKNKRVDEVVSPEFLRAALEMEKSLLSAPGQMTMELSHVKDNGEPFAFLVNEATYLESDNSIGGTVTLMIDITEQKKLQEKTRAALEKEQELNELKSSFISMASHEFRTPLTSILASADLLEMFGRQWKEEKYMEHIGKIQKGVEYMKELLDDVLIISRNEEGKTRFTPSKINFFELCSELLDSAKASAAVNHKFTFNYRPEAKHFTLDPKLLTHIVSNLLSNAVKYSPDGGNVVMEVSCENGNILVNISDEGIGIPKKDRERLFEPFYRAENTYTIHGTGLGMSIVKRAVDLHGGCISVESEENRGTSVHVSIPYKQNV